MVALQSRRATVNSSHQETRIDPLFDWRWRRAARRLPLTLVVAIVVAVTVATGALSAQEVATPAQPSSSRSAALQAAPPDADAVIGFLSEVITWYRWLDADVRLATEPSERLLAADSRRMANQVFEQAFEFARAETVLLTRFEEQNGKADASRAGTPALPTVLGELAQGAAAEQARVDAAEARLKNLQARLSTATGARRTALRAQAESAQSELELARARVETLRAMIQFESARTAQEQPQAGLLEKIAELERAIPAAERTAQRGEAAAQPAGTEPGSTSGIIGAGRSLIAQQSKSRELEQAIEWTQGLRRHTDLLRDQLRLATIAFEARGVELARQAGSGDLAAARRRKREVEKLVELHKLATMAALPLSKQSATLGVFTSNLEHWRATVDERWLGDLRRLAARLGAIAVLLGLVFGAAYLWRRATFRYVHDPRRRMQLLEARRVVLGLVVVAILLFSSATELGQAATVLGFAAAGVALALQNVILSVAGYFFLIGRYGVKVGDRITVGGVTGDVVDIGLVKLSMLELTGISNERQPTGRVVVFSNAVVFQPQGNFFRQLPGTSYVWNEIKLTLAPECDYRLAEKRMLDAVDEVFARYRDNVDREYRGIERDFTLAFETPRPVSRMSLTQNGLEVTLRYPAEARAAAEIADEVSRRVLDAIQREPELRLVGRLSANVQAAPAEAAYETTRFKRPA